MKKYALLAWLSLSTVANYAVVDVVYSTLPGAGFLFDSQYDINGANAPTGYQEMAAAFTPTSTVSLTGIQLVVDSFSGSTNYSVEVTKSVGGKPGSALESFALTFPAFPGLQQPSITTINSVLKPTLSANTTYWVVVAPDDANAQGGWYIYADGLPHGTSEVAFSPDQWRGPYTQNTPLFQVTGAAAEPTPEPSTLTLLAIGALCSLGYGWRRRKLAQS